VELIKKVGSPFVEPLLDRLVSEEDRTIRYFYLDLLGELGTTVKEPAVKKLKDNRWFLVRNLIILLRNLNDPSVLPALHNLLEHPHPRVRHELMQTLIKFNDPVAERIILQEMDSPDTGRCLKAISLAGMTRNTFISQKLLEFLKQRGLGKTILPIKKASVHALGEIGDPSALPTLQDILKARTFFRRHSAMNLKLEIIDSLKKYPAGDASPILKGLASSGPQSLVNHARTVMKNMGVGPS
jgi:HEAT repeat protein